MGRRKPISFIKNEKKAIVSDDVLVPSTTQANATGSASTPVALKAEVRSTELSLDAAASASSLPVVKVENAVLGAPLPPLSSPAFSTRSTSASNITTRSISAAEETSSSLPAVVVATEVPPTPAEKPKTANMYKIAGADVQFLSGFEPFAAQKAIMSQVITACNRKVHALLESPTGTGKTLALLCGALAYQKAKRMEYYTQLAHRSRLVAELMRKEAAIDKSLSAGGADKDVLTAAKAQLALAKQAIPEVPAPPKIIFTSRTHSQLAQVIKEYRRCNFYHSLSHFTHTDSSEATVHGMMEEFRYKEDAAKEAATPSTSSSPCQTKSILPPVSMTILASRTHFCVNDSLTRPAKRRGPAAATQDKENLSLDESCKQLLKNSGCEYNNRTESFRQTLPVVWDIEEAVHLAKHGSAAATVSGKRRAYNGFPGGGCPFFASRMSYAGADIVFAPYNYILDPVLRSTMQIDVSGAVVIIDEAHNVEDVAMDAAGATLTREQLLETCFSLQRLVLEGIQPAVHIPLFHLVYRIGMWLDLVARSLDVGSIPPQEFPTLKLPTADETSGGGGFLSQDAPAIPPGGQLFGSKKNEMVWSNDKVKRVVSDWRITPASFRQWFDLYEQAMAIKADTGVADTQLSSQACKVLERLLTVLGYLMMLEEDRYGIAKTMPYPYFLSVSAFVTNSKWPATVTLQFGCMSAALAFREIAETAHSVVLTSGTLAPLNSFAGALGTRFPVRLEAGHVINASKQLWIGVVDASPSIHSASLVFRVDQPPWLHIAPTAHRHNLSGTYQNAQSDDYIDAIGVAILDVACSVPGGALVFFPSYRMLTRATERWQRASIRTSTRTMSLWDAINATKQIFSEERESPEEFSSMLQSFRECNDKWLQKTRNDAAAANTATTASSVDESDEAYFSDGGMAPLGFFPSSEPYGTSTKTSSSIPSNGGILLAVCRGKASEGLDFSDHHARAVIIVGIPYANVQESQVVLKRKFLDDKLRSFPTADGLDSLSGNQWYQQQAFRALNQALGRCIRHRNDYGAVVLLDPRFNGDAEIAGLSKWARPHVRKHVQLEDACQQLKAFYASNESAMEAAAVKAAAGCGDVVTKATQEAPSSLPVSQPPTPSLLTARSDFYDT